MRKMADKHLNLQDQFLNAIRRTKVPTTIFLIKGVKLQGIVTWFDPFALLLRRDGNSQLVYKHSISTIMPSQIPPELATAKTGEGATGRRSSLQDVFLEAAARDLEPMTVFLVNGVMLQGSVVGYDQFSLMLERGGQVQLVYKHAISTLQPDSPLDLSGEDNGEVEA